MSLVDTLFEKKKVPERTTRWVEIRMLDDSGRMCAIKTNAYPIDFVDNKDQLKQTLLTAFTKLLDKMLP